ncbi:hypothetical protein IQ254_21235 [Nodosilinea sp. LEGE 07088]|uniref:hypothetical protein n=1 Tax=Nodosilinea sp. LEGE 07088 TaxID=2777968 RepID=UPI001880F207|nr:hypothetical protein [Nodosilinea sp. LEGE 07088]MBE9139689.1 hypothetical protein [Nodosilinea sp. LEGE 07088]
MDSVMLSTPFEPAALAEVSTADLKSSLLKLVDQRDADPMAQKVRFAYEALMPLFNELAKRNPTPDLHQQIPLLKGVWMAVWSTNPFQDLLPGRVRHESYQIFDSNGYYANLARYKPGRKTPFLSWMSRWLLSYDLMIMQSYSVQTGSAARPQTWDIQNVCIRQGLRFGSRAFSAATAAAWFRQTAANYASNPQPQPSVSQPTRGANRVSTRQYEQIAKARPQLDNLYIDAGFRLVKTQREKSQRPSYTVAVRLP